MKVAVRELEEQLGLEEEEMVGEQSELPEEGGEQKEMVGVEVVMGRQSEKMGLLVFEAYYPVVPAVVGTTSSCDITDFEASGGCLRQEGVGCFCHTFTCIYI